MASSLVSDELLSFNLAQCIVRMQATQISCVPGVSEHLFSFRLQDCREHTGKHKESPERLVFGWEYVQTSNP
jgi:hypothetical protein